MIRKELRLHSHHPQVNLIKFFLLKPNKCMILSNKISAETLIAVEIMWHRNLICNGAADHTIKSTTARKSQS